jgi:hypothetical protein
MATRKQRARRAKTFRHDYALVDTDEQGNEVELKASELRAKKQDGSKPNAKPGTKPGAKTPAARRLTKEPPPPSWERALKRGAMWGVPMVAVMYFFLKNDPVQTRILICVIYAVMFVPLTYWLDGLVYRKWERRQQSGPASRSGKSR